MGPSLVSLLLVATAVAAPKPARRHWEAPTAAAVERALAETRGAPVVDRLEPLTRAFVGAPYVLSPLGEGTPGSPDPDPRIRLDAFDCTTFVETAIALARTSSLAAMADVLDRLRYRGLPAYETRRHLTESAWIPDLVAAGELEDVTARIGGEHTISSTFTLTASRWKRRSIARALELPEAALPTGAHPLPWIPIAALSTLDLPPGTIINVVREDVPWSPTRITHQGLVLRDPRTGKLMVRHASPVAKRVVDEPIENMIRRYLHPKVERKWKPVGVNLLRVRE